MRPDISLHSGPGDRYSLEYVGGEGEAGPYVMLELAHAGLEPTHSVMMFLDRRALEKFVTVGVEAGRILDVHRAEFLAAEKAADELAEGEDIPF